MNDNDHNVPLEDETKERLTYAMKHLTNQGLSELIDIINEEIVARTWAQHFYENRN